MGASAHREHGWGIWGSLIPGVYPVLTKPCSEQLYSRNMEITNLMVGGWLGQDTTSTPMFSPRSSHIPFVSVRTTPAGKSQRTHCWFSRIGNSSGAGHSTVRGFSFQVWISAAHKYFLQFFFSTKQRFYGQIQTSSSCAIPCNVHTCLLCTPRLSELLLGM